jgi:hypothetical protein
MSPVFYNSEALYIFKIVSDISGKGGRFAGFRMVLVNVTKTQSFAAP